MCTAEASLLVLGERNRLRLLRLLLEEPLSVGQLCSHTGLGQSLVSHHLAILASHGWVSAQQQGRQRVYRSLAAGSVLQPLARWIRREVSLPAGWSASPRQPDGQAKGGRRGGDLEDYLL